MKISNIKSFSLFEIIIAALLIVIVAIAFFNVFVTVYNYLRHTMELRTATLALQEEVSMVRELEFADIRSLGGSFLSSLPASLDSVTGTIDQSTYEDDKIIKITFSIDWTSFNGSPMHKSLVTLMTDHGINKK